MTDVTIPTLADAGMLVYTKISCWSARKLDRKQTEKTIKGAGATNDAARVNKHLLANADSLLREVARAGNAIRDYIDNNTLPWDDAGNRFVSNDKALAMVGELKELEDVFNAAVDAFVAEYPILRAQALQNLGDMANNDDYPQPDVVRGKFSVRVSFSPLATGFGDARVDMSEAQAKAWQAHFEGNVQKQINEALASAYDRLRENLQRYSDRLKVRDDGSGKMEIFRDTMVTSMRDTLALLSSLNVFGDQKLMALVDEVSRDIASYEPDVLRTNATTVKVVKSSVDDILSRLAGL